jgi:hypothetical protein
MMKMYPFSESASVSGSEDTYVSEPPGSISQSYGSENQDAIPDPYQNVTDLQHGKKGLRFSWRTVV